MKSKAWKCFKPFLFWFFYPILKILRCNLYAVKCTDFRLASVINCEMLHPCNHPSSHCKFLSVLLLMPVTIPLPPVLDSYFLISITLVLHTVEFINEKNQQIAQFYAIFRLFEELTVSMENTVAYSFLLLSSIPFINIW